MATMICARTNAEFLNQAFGMNYKAWMKSRWDYDEHTWVWMIRFDRPAKGWVNRMVNDNVIHEEYCGDTPPTYTHVPEKKYRIVVEIRENAFGREYYVLGKYEFDSAQSRPGCHVFVKTEN